MASAPGRKYRPGSRIPRFRGTGRMSENRVAWLRTIVGQLVIMRFPHSEELEEGEEPVLEIGDDIRLYIPRPNARPFSINITALTEAELTAMEEFFTLLFRMARPVVQQRDKVAQDALAAGDDSFVRVYRDVPQFVIRKGAEQGHDQSVHDRPEDASSGSGRGGSTTDGLRKSSDVLASNSEARESGGPKDGGS